MELRFKCNEQILKHSKDFLNYSFDTQDDAENKRLINKGLNIHTV